MNSIIETEGEKQHIGGELKPVTKTEEVFVTKNAVISATSLGITPQGFFTFLLHLDLEDQTKGNFGGYCLDQPCKSSGARREGTAYGCDFIVRIIRLFGKRWETLPMSPCRIRYNDKNQIIAIGHYILNQWIVPSELVGGIFSTTCEEQQKVAQ